MRLQAVRKKRKVDDVAVQTDTKPVRLRVIDDAPRQPKDITATHRIPSGLGGVFRVEVLERKGKQVLVRIHMPGSEWHHWRGSFWVDETTMSAIDRR